MSQIVEMDICPGCGGIDAGLHSGSHVTDSIFSIPAICLDGIAASVTVQRIACISPSTVFQFSLTTILLQRPTRIMKSEAVTSHVLNRILVMAVTRNNTVGLLPFCGDTLSSIGSTHQQPTISSVSNVPHIGAFMVTRFL